MKRSIISAAVLSAVFMSAGAFAADSDQGELIITGKVVGTTCKFTGDTTATIAMNEIGVDRLNSVSAGGIYDGYSNKTTMPLSVECDPGVTPHISFSSSQFNPGANNTITINTASKDNGAGFAVYYNGTLIKPDSNIDLGTSPQGDGKYNLDFTARYANLSGTVIPGDVTSSVTMTVVAD